MQNDKDELSSGGILRDYGIHSVIGRGGFGVVYKGKHRELGIEVAIKEYFPSELCIRYGQKVQPSKPEFQTAYEESLDRFIREAKQLEKFRDCPNIVTCRDLFRSNGTAYIVMDYVHGLPLSELLERREARDEPFTEQDLLQVILPLLRDLQIVHKSGVCHRDIKPSNILIRRTDNASILIDFGAAKHEISKHTKSFAPYSDGYAALEQVGEGEIGPWTDMYGVGAVMWRMVAGGAPPFSPPNPTTSQRRAFELMQGRVDPLPSAKTIGQIRFSDMTLETIDACLEISLKHRLKSCHELSQRLSGNSRSLADTEGHYTSISGSTIGISEITLKQSGGVLSVAFSPDGSRLISGLGDKTIRLLNIASGREIRRFTGHTDGVSSVVFSPDGSRLASGSWDKTIRLWDIASGREIRRFTGKEDWSGHNPVAVAFSPDGSRLVSGSNSKILLWDIASGREIVCFTGHKGRFFASSFDIAFSPDISQLVSGSSDKKIRLWDIASGQGDSTLYGAYELGSLRSVFSRRLSTRIRIKRRYNSVVGYCFGQGDSMLPGAFKNSVFSRRLPTSIWIKRQYNSVVGYCFGQGDSTLPGA